VSASNSQGTGVGHLRYGTDLRDRWTATPIAHERTRFLELLFDWQSARAGRQVVIISGDDLPGQHSRYAVPAGRAFSISGPAAP